MEIFKLFGRIFVDNEGANRRLDDTDKKAEGVASRFGSMVATAAKWGAGIAAGAAAAGAALGGLVTRAAHTGGEIVRLSQATGFSTRGFQQWDFVMKQFNFSMEQAQGDLAALAERAMDAANGVGEGKEMFDALGVSVTDTSGRLKSQEQIFNEVIAALQDMEDVTRRNAIASALLNTTGEELIPILNMTAEELARMKASANIISDADLDRAEKFRLLWGQARQLLGNLVTDIGLKLLPVFEGLLRFSIEQLPKIGPIFEFIGEVVEIVIRHTSRALQPFFDAVGGFLGRAWNFTIEIAGAAWDWIVGTSWAEKWEDITGWLNTLWQWTIGIAGAAWDWITGTTWQEKMADIRGWIETAWEWVVNVAGSAWAWLDERFPVLTGALETVWGLIGRAWNWVINLAGGAWDWIVGTTWSEKWADIISFLSTAYEWVINIAGSAWAWLDERFPALREGLQFIADFLGRTWEWFVDVSGMDEAIETIGRFKDLIIALASGIAAGTTAFFAIRAGIAIYTSLTTAAATATSAMTAATAALNAAMAFLTSPIFLISAGIGAVVAAGVWLVRNWDTVTQWAGRLRDSLADLVEKGLQAVQGLAEGIAEWWGESKLGKTFSWLNDQVGTAIDWFARMYDAVVGNSYVPDMVEEIGQAVARLREKLANPIARYTAEALVNFEGLSEGAALAATEIAEAFDDMIGTLGKNIGDMVTDITATFFNGTATWAGVLEEFTGFIGSSFRSLFNTIAVELAKNILAQNTWLTSTLANVAAAVSAYLSQAFAALTAFFWWAGPAAPVLAGGVIAAAVAAIAALGGQVVRSIMPSVGGGTPPPDDGRDDSAAGSPGRQVSEITGPTRDLLTTLLSPLARLDEQTGILGRIYDLLDARLPMMGGLALAGGPSFQITVYAGLGADGRQIGEEVIDVIEERLADRLEDERRGESR